MPKRMLGRLLNTPSPEVRKLAVQVAGDLGNAVDPRGNEKNVQEPGL